MEQTHCEIRLTRSTPASAPVESAKVCTLPAAPPENLGWGLPPQLQLPGGEGLTSHGYNNMKMEDDTIRYSRFN